MAHWVYIFSAASGLLGLAACRAFLMLIGGLTKDPQRSEQCERMIILSRRDAKQLLERATDSSDKHESAATSADQPKARPRPGNNNRRSGGRRRVRQLHNRAD